MSENKIFDEKSRKGKEMANKKLYLCSIPELSELLAVTKEMVVYHKRQRNLMPVAISPKGTHLFNYEEALEVFDTHSNVPGKFTPLKIIERRSRKGYIKKDSEAKLELERRNKNLYPLEKYEEPEVEDWLIDPKKIKRYSKKKTLKIRKKLNGNSSIKSQDTASTKDTILDGDVFIMGETLEMQRQKVTSDAEKQFYAAKKEKMNFLQKSGALTETDLIGDIWLVLSTIVTKGLMAIPDRVSALYASMDNSDEIKKSLRAELQIGLTRLKFDLKGLQEEITKGSGDGDNNTVKKTHKIKNKKA